MKATLEDISSVKKKLAVEIEAAQVDRELDKAYKTLRKNAKIRGFRPGKAPRSILEQHYGAQVSEDVSRDLINETFPKACEEVESFPLGAPLLEKEALTRGRNFKYSADMEVRPRFQLPKYLGLQAEKEMIKITDQDIQNRIELIRKSHGDLRSIEEERPLRNEDYAVLEYEGFEGDQPLEAMKSNDFLLQLGSGNFHPDFEKALIGLNKEDQTEFEIAFEADFKHSALAGKNVRFQVKILDIKEMNLPELNDEFVQNLGADMKTLEDLAEMVREQLTEDAKKRSDSDVKKTLLDRIAGEVEFELPSILVREELESQVERLKANLTRSGNSLEKAGISAEAIQEQFRPAAEKQVKDALILGEIAQKEDISVAEQDLIEGFEKLAAAIGQDPITIRQYYEKQNLTASFKEKLREEKTLNYLIEHAKLTEVEPAPQEEVND